MALLRIHSLILSPRSEHVIVVGKNLWTTNSQQERVLDAQKMAWLRVGKVH
jgi:hypothetical protein